MVIESVPDESWGKPDKLTYCVGDLSEGLEWLILFELSVFIGQ